MQHGEAAFVDSGAWIALALSRDPLHPRARDQWEVLQGAGARLHTSVPVVIETFTFLDRNANRDVALAWKESIHEPRTVKILPCDLRDIEESWEYFRRQDLHKLSAVDATSFAIMKHSRIRLAFAFDHHFSVAGFRLVA
jgi:predicted nucleic acid-binding protein